MALVAVASRPRFIWMRPQQNSNSLVDPTDIDTCHVTCYITSVIKTFADRRTEALFVTGRASRVPADLARRALRKLESVHVAARLDDLRVPPGNRLHALKGDRKGQHAIAVNDQWRICFRFVEGEAHDVEFCDYH